MMINYLVLVELNHGRMPLL